MYETCCVPSATCCVRCYVASATAVPRAPPGATVPGAECSATCTSPHEAHSTKPLHFARSTRHVHEALNLFQLRARPPCSFSTLDPLFGLLEAGVAEPGQLHAAFVEGERRLERLVALLELLTMISSSARAASKSLMLCVHVQLSSARRLHVALDFALAERDAHGVASGDIRGRPNHARAGGVPANGVAAAEDGQRAQRVESSGRAEKLRRRLAAAGAERRPGAARRRPAAPRPARRRRGSFRPASGRATAIRRPDARRRSMHGAAECCARSPTWRPRIASAARHSAMPAAALQHVHARPRTVSSRRRSAASRRSPLAIDPRDELVAPRDHGLGRRRRRRRAEIGDEVGDGDVGLVADRGDDRHRACGDGARDDLLVERPEILDRPAAARDDARRPRRARARSRAGRGRYPARRHRPARAPAGSRRAPAGSVGPAPTMSRIAAPSSDVTTPIFRGSTGSGRLRACVEQSLRPSRRFSCSKASCSAPSPRGSSVLADDLIFALRLVDAQPSAHDDVLAVLGLEFQQPDGRPEHHAADLRAAVLQCEVEVTGVPALAVRDLALDADLAKPISSTDGCRP